MAKKKQGKKHKFKYATAGGVGQDSVAGDSSTSVGTTKHVAAIGQRSRAMTLGPVRDFSYVSVDLRRIAILAASLVVLEAIIWFIFGHTGVGTAVYQMVKV